MLELCAYKHNVWKFLFPNKLPESGKFIPKSKCRHRQRKHSPSTKKNLHEKQLYLSFAAAWSESWIMSSYHMSVEKKIYYLGCCFQDKRKKCEDTFFFSFKWFTTLFRIVLLHFLKSTVIIMDENVFLVATNILYRYRCISFELTMYNKQ